MDNDLMRAFITPQALALVVTIIPLAMVIIYAVRGWRVENSGHRRSARVIKAGEPESGYVSTTVVWRTDAGPEMRKTFRMSPENVPDVGGNITVIYPDDRPELACPDQPAHIYHLCYRWLTVWGVVVGAVIVILLVLRLA